MTLGARVPYTRAAMIKLFRSILRRGFGFVTFATRVAMRTILSGSCRGAVFMTLYALSEFSHRITKALEKE